MNKKNCIYTHKEAAQINHLNIISSANHLHYTFSKCYKYNYYWLNVDSTSLFIITETAPNKYNIFNTIIVSQYINPIERLQQQQHFEVAV